MPHSFCLLQDTFKRLILIIIAILLIIVALILIITIIFVFDMYR